LDAIAAILKGMYVDVEREAMRRTYWSHNRTADIGKLGKNCNPLGAW
jgi:hypothetical protein